MTIRLAIIGLGLAAASSALAQTDPVTTARLASANQLGLMEYCQGQGYADGDAVTAQRSNLERLPPAPAGGPSMDAAQALGRGGTMSMNGQDYTLSSLASAHGSTVGALCGQMASSAKMAAAAQQQSGTIPTIPGMPAMPSVPGGMPAMPSMPGMPSVPGMPAAPK